MENPWTVSQNPTFHDKRVLNKQNEKGNTLLHIACKLNNIQECEELLKKGAHPNLRNKKGQTPLFIACRRHNAKIVELLLVHGADPLISPEDEHMTMTESPHQNLTLLERANNNVETYIMSNKPKTCIFEAARWVDLDIYTMLITHYENKKSHEFHLEDVCLRIAYDAAKDEYKHNDDRVYMFRRTISECVSIYYGNSGNNESQEGLLKNDVFWNNEKVVSMIIRGDKHGEITHTVLKHVNLWNLWDAGIMHYLEAIFMYRNAELFDYFIQLSPVLLDDALNNEGDTFLHVACDMQDVDMVEVVLRYCNEEQINKQNSKLETPLHMFAKRSEQWVIAKLLVEKGVDVNIEDKDKRTPLFYAVQQNAHDVVKYLLQHGADKKINIQDVNKEGILNMVQDDFRMLKILIQHGASTITNMSYISHLAALPNQLPMYDIVLDDFMTRLRDVQPNNFFVRETYIFSLLQKSASSHNHQFIRRAIQKLQNTSIDFLTEDMADRMSDLADMNFGMLMTSLIVEYKNNQQNMDKIKKFQLKIMRNAWIYQKDALILRLLQISPNLIYEHVTVNHTKNPVISIVYLQGLRSAIENVLFNTSDITRLMTLMCQRIHTGETLLHILCSYPLVENSWTKLDLKSSIEILRRMIEVGSCIDAKDDYGVTPLMKAAFSEKPKTFVKELVKYTHALKTKDPKGDYTIYVNFRHPTWKFHLPNTSKLQSSTQKNHKTQHLPVFAERICCDGSIHVSIDSSNFDHIRKVIENGIIMDDADEKGHTALYYACETKEDNFEVIETLLSSSEIVSIQNRNGKYLFDEVKEMELKRQKDLKYSNKIVMLSKVVLQEELCVKLAEYMDAYKGEPYEPPSELQKTLISNNNTMNMEIDEEQKNINNNKLFVNPSELSHAKPPKRKLDFSDPTETSELKSAKKILAIPELFENIIHEFAKQLGLVINTVQTRLVMEYYKEFIDPKTRPVMLRIFKELRTKQYYDVHRLGEPD